MNNFCFIFRRLRNIKPGESKYQLLLDTLKVSEQSLEATLVNTEANANFKFILTALVDNSFRIVADEVKPLYPRYRVEQSLAGEPQAVG